MLLTQNPITCNVIFPLEKGALNLSKSASKKDVPQINVRVLLDKNLYISYKNMLEYEHLTAALFFHKCIKQKVFDYQEKLKGLQTELKLAKKEKKNAVA